MSVAAAKANRTNSISQQLPIMISNNFNKAHFVVRNSMLKPENGNHVQKKGWKILQKKTLTQWKANSGVNRFGAMLTNVSQC